MSLKTQSFAIVGGRLLDPSTGVDFDGVLVVRDGRIAGVERTVELPHDLAVVDARGCWVLPGFVELHAHLREPGDEHKETIETGARAAVAGGFTTVVAMPNTRPVLDNAALVRFVTERARAVGLAKILPSAAVTLGQKGEKLAEFAELAEAGAVCFTDDGRPIVHAGIMRRAMEYATLVDRPIMVHEEEPGLAGGCMHEGVVSTRLGLRGNPSAAEDVMVHRDVVLSELTGARLHVGHISTRESVRAVRLAKERGLRVTAEATPHHFSLTDAAVGAYDTLAKMAPPLRPASDRDAVIEGLADGTIDAIATDHAPHATVDKEVEFERAANGVVGLETALGLTLKLVREGRLSERRAVELLTSGPARAFSLDAGTLRVGAAADLVLVDPTAEWTVRPELFFSKSRNTPFAGWTLPGVVRRTYVDGEAVFLDGRPVR